MASLRSRFVTALFPAIDDSRAEEAFRAAETPKALRASLTAICISIACTGLVLLCESVLGLAGSMNKVVAICRGVGIGVTGLLPALLLAKVSSRISLLAMESLLVGVFSAQTACTIGTSLIATTGGLDAAAVFGPFRGWSTATLILSSALIHMSGLPFFLILTVELVKSMLLAASLVIFYTAMLPTIGLSSNDAPPTPELVCLVAAFTCATLLTSFFHERSARSEFLALRQVTADLATHERLLHRMVPPHILEALMRAPSRTCDAVAPLPQLLLGTTPALHSASSGSSCSATSLRSVQTTVGSLVHSAQTAAVATLMGASRVVRTRRRTNRSSIGSRLPILARRASLDLPSSTAGSQPWRRRSSIDVAASTMLGLSALVAGSETERRISVVADAAAAAAAVATASHDATSAPASTTPPLARLKLAAPNALTEEHVDGSGNLLESIRASEEASCSTLSALPSQREGSSSTILQLLPEATVMFIGVANFDALSSRMRSQDTLSAMNALYSLCDSFVESKFGVYKVLAIGGAYLCVASANGLGRDNPFHARSCVEAGASILISVLRAGPALHFAGESPLLKIGLCTGPIAAGVIGTRTLNWHIFGDVVNTASRMCSNSQPWSIQLHPSTVASLRCAPAQSTGAFLPRGFWLKARGPTFFKGKGVISSSWVRTNFLDRAIASEFPELACTSDSPNVAPDDSMAETCFPPTSCSGGSFVPPPPKEHHVAAPFALPDTEMPVHHVGSSFFLAFANPEDEVAFVSSITTPALRGMLVLVSAFLLFIVAMPAAVEQIVGAAVFSPPNNFSQATSIALLVVLWAGIFAIYELQFHRLGAFPLQCCRSLSQYLWKYSVCAPFESLAVAACISSAIASVSFIDAAKPSGFVETANVLVCFLALQSITGTRSLWTLTGNAAASAIFIVYLLVSCLQFVDVITSIAVLAVGGALGWVLGRHHEATYRATFAAILRAGNRHARCEQLLRNMLPSRDHVQRVIAGETVVDFLHGVPLLYSDIRGFTDLCARIEPFAVTRLLDDLYTRFDKHLDAFNLWKIDTVGDAFIVIGGLREPGAAAVSASLTGQPVSEPQRSVAPSHHLAQRPHYVRGAARVPAQVKNRQVPLVVEPPPAVACDWSMGDPGGGRCSATDIDWANPPSPRSRRVLDDTGAVALFALDMLAELEQARASGAYASLPVVSTIISSVLTAPVFVNYAQLSAAYAGVLPAPLEMRIGIHVGDVAGGIVGWARPRYFVWGRDAVIANLLESSGLAGQVHVSEAAGRLLHAQGFELAPRPEPLLLQCPPTHASSGSGGPGGSEGSSGTTMRTFFVRGFRFECGTPEGGTDDVVVRVEAAVV